MSPLRSVTLLAALLLTLAPATSLAQQKKDEQNKGEQKKDDGKAGGEDPFGDLFGDSLDGDKVDLKGLTKDVKKGKRNTGLKAKQAVIKDKISIKLERVFAAKMIRMDRRRGCVPADRAKMKITSITVDDVPVRSPPFAVCLSIASDAHRSVRITTTVVSPKNRKIARAESTIDFRGKPNLDHIMEFPPVELRQTGQFFYAVDIDGKPAGRLPLFNVVKEQVEEQAVPVEGS